MTTTNELFTQIAREHLDLETLEQRNRDSLDFHDVGVVGVQRALDAAYRAGQAELLAAAEADAKCWGKVGDLGKVRSDLIDLVGFMSGNDREAIERFLAE